MRAEAILLFITGCNNLTARQVSQDAIVCGAPSPSSRSFRYHGGDVLRRPTVVNVMWGDVDCADDLDTAMGVLTGAYLGNLIDMYGDVKSSGVFLGRTNVSAPPPSTLAQIDDVVSRFEPGFVYMVWLPDGVNVDAGSVGRSCRDWCGYHSTAGDVVYAVMFEDSVGCPVCGSHEDIGTRTMVASHELAEMVTDPHFDGWNAGDDGEAGDICNWQRYDYRGVSAQCLWSERDGACIHVAE